MNLEETIDKFSERLERSARMAPKGKVKTALVNATKALIKASTAIVQEEVDHLREKAKLEPKQKSLTCFCPAELKELSGGIFQATV